MKQSSFCHKGLLLCASVWCHHSHICGENELGWADSARLPPSSLQGSCIGQTIGLHTFMLQLKYNHRCPFNLSFSCRPTGNLDFVDHVDDEMAPVVNW